MKNAEIVNVERLCWAIKCRAVGTGAAGPAGAGPIFSAPTPKNNGATHTRFIHNPHNYGLGMRLRTVYLTYNTWQRRRIWTSLRSIWLSRTFLPNSFDRRKRLVFQSDSLVVRVTRGVSTLAGVTRPAALYDVYADATFCYLGGYVRRSYTTCSQIAIILQPES